MEKQRAQQAQLKRRQAVVRERVIEREEQRHRKPTLGYLILTAVFSSLVFLFLYYGYLIIEYDGIRLFFAIFVANILAGLIGSWVARMFTANFDDITKTSQQINRALISALIYTIIVYVGLLRFLQERYVDIKSMAIVDFCWFVVSKEFWEVLAILIAVKAFVYLFSDFMADKFSFGG